MANKVVIFGGSFDPVHIGHVEIIKHLAAKFDLCVVLPCFVSPFKLPAQNGGDAVEMRSSCLGHVQEVHSRHPETTQFTPLTTIYHGQEFAHKTNKLPAQNGGDAVEMRSSCLGHVQEVHSRHPETTQFTPLTTIYHGQEFAHKTNKLPAQNGGDAVEMNSSALCHDKNSEITANWVNCDGEENSLVCCDGEARKLASDIRAQERLEMLELALNGIDKVRIDTFELKSVAPSYTYLSLEHFAEEFPNSELYFAIGTDSLINLSGWKNIKRITELARFYVIPRPHFVMNEGATNELRSCGARYEVSDIVGKDISSSEIKVASSFGRIREYVPESVALYIFSNQLYGDYDYIVSRFGEFELSESRVAHIYRTVKVGIALAKINQVSTDKVITALLLHDIAKNTSEQDIAGKGYPIPAEIVLYPDKCKHAILGAVVARYDFHIESPDILDAIANHTTANEQMTVLAEIVFLSDYIEEERKFKGIDNIRKIVYSDIKQGMLAVLTSTIEYLTMTKSDICVKSVLALQAYQNKGVNHGKKNS